MKYGDGRDSREAHWTAGQGDPVLKEQSDNLRETDGGNTQIVTAKPQAWQAKDKTEYSRYNYTG
jgi:hypothetical protein